MAIDASTCCYVVKGGQSIANALIGSIVKRGSPCGVENASELGHSSADRCRAPQP
jgi:hypothetical protein